MTRIAMASATLALFALPSLAQEMPVHEATLKLTIGAQGEKEGKDVTDQVVDSEKAKETDLIEACLGAVDKKQDRLIFVTQCGTPNGVLPLYLETAGPNFTQIGEFTPSIPLFETKKGVESGFVASGELTVECDEEGGIPVDLDFFGFIDLNIKAQKDFGDELCADGGSFEGMGEGTVGDEDVIVEVDSKIGKPQQNFLPM